MVVSTKRRCELQLYVVSKPRRLLSEVVHILLIFAQRNAKAEMYQKSIKNAVLYCVITQSKTNLVCTIFKGELQRYHHKNADMSLPCIE